MKWLAVLALVAVAAVVALVAVDFGDDQPTTTIPGDADPEAVAVIDDWSTTLRHGNVDGAARLFAIPSVAENGPTLIEIEDIEDARLFNASLPCGARLVEAEQEGEFTIATFELTERPGPGSCGSGTGASAMTAFVIEDGRIAEWRRVATADSEQDRPS